MTSSKQPSAAGTASRARQALVVLAGITIALHASRTASAAELLPDGKPSPMPVGKMDLTYESVCGDISHVQDKNSTNQIQKYCDANKAADKAAKAEKTMFMVYGGVAGICASMCVVTMANQGTPNQEMVTAANLMCMGSALGGAGMDAMTTKNYQSAMQGMMGAAGGLMMGGGLSGAAAGGGANMASCMSAMVAGGQMFQKQQAQKDDEKKAKENLENAAALKYAPGTVTPAPAAAVFSPEGSSHSLSADGGTSGSGGGSSSSGHSSTLANTGSTSKTDSLCSAGAAGNGAAAIQCAVAYDKNLNGATDPSFGQALKTISGKDPNEFMNNLNNGNAGSALANNMGGLFNSAGIGKLEAAFRQLEDPNYVSSTGSYAAGGGGASRGGSGGDAGSDSGAPDMAKMMADMMNGGKGGDDAGRSAASVEAFGERMRKLASIQSPEENRGISIFERVSSRYYMIDKTQSFSSTISSPRR